MHIMITPSGRAPNILSLALELVKQVTSNFVCMHDILPPKGMFSEPQLL